MNHINKDPVSRDIVCKSHSARSERDIYRVCPSKLNKRELEDLYFALLENNLELKRTINVQRDKIKTLSTKVQRMTAAQKGSFDRESRECCLATKAVVNEQKDMIAELKKSNERMSERIRLLNMRLCSAKQFVKRSPTQSTTHCIKCSELRASTPKNSTIALMTSVSNLQTIAVSCHDLEKGMPSTRSVQTETNEEHEKDDPEKPCDENKCRTLMEELKQKIVNLQEELSTTHTEYSSRIGRLETEVSTLQERDRESHEIASRLTRAEVQNGELAMELAIEKGKVAEMETRVKAAQMSSKVAATIEEHLASIEQARRESYYRTVPISSPSCPAEWEEQSPRLQVQQSTPTKVISTVEFRVDNYDLKSTKNSEDSGYTEANKSTEISDDKGLNKINQELMKKIVDLQTQLDHFQITARGESLKNENKYELPDKSLDASNDKIIEPLSVLIKNEGCVVIEPYKDDISEPTVDQVVDIQQNDTNSAQFTANVPPMVREQSSTIIPTVNYRPVGINNGEKIIEDTDESPELGSYTIRPRVQPRTPEAIPDTPEPVRDDHNRFQMPGPISDPPNKTARRQSVDTKNSTSKESPKSKNDVANVVKDSKPEVQCYLDKTSEEDKTNVNFVNGSKETLDIDKGSVKIVDNKCKKNSIEVIKQKLVKKSKTRSIDVVEENRIGRDVQDHSFNNYVDTRKYCRELSVNQGRSEGEIKDTRLGTQIDKAVETCPSYKPLVEDVPATYTVQTDRHDSRASDKDTDHEISAMTDLSTEKDDKSPETLSPGEDKATSTYTRSSSAPTTDYGTLSEGELPTVTRARKLSVGERPMADCTSGVRRKSSQQKMEEALHAVTEELARCKQLLLKQRQHQRGNVKSVDADVMAEFSPPIALKRAPGNQRIADTFTPKCIFTLHIGTVVLSDEAVMNSTDMSLVLSWKFYDQHLAMTRMRAGRVVLFDFSTEYDVKMTDDFLNYMKQEEMPITICQLDKQDEPFASCSLPLRDALLHTNKRADMSLALVAGPRPGGDELGVLDLWCTLRAQPRLLPAINRAIARPAPHKTKTSSVHSMPNRSTSRIMEQILEDDQSNERLSQELDLNVGQRPRQSQDNGVSSSHWDTARGTSVESRVGHISQKRNDTPTVAPAYDYYDVNKYPVVRRRSSQNPRRPGQSDLLNTDFGPKSTEEIAPKKLDGGSKRQPSFQNISSGIIISEVPANIRSTEELKQALERNAQANNLHVTTRLQTQDESDSQDLSDVISLRSVITQRQKYMGPSALSIHKPEKHESEAGSMKKKRRRSSRFSFFKEKKPTLDVPRPKKFIQVDSEQEIAKQYDNISKFLGSCRMQDNSKKSVKIDQKYCETPTEIPQKDVPTEESREDQSMDITILWLALNEECEAMMNPKIQRLYVAYSFLGRCGADLETPVSLPKPQHYVEKCYFNFKKTFQLHDCDLPLLGHLARCRSANRSAVHPKDCIIFSVISEPPEDPLGLDNCEDIGQAYMYLGDILACSAGSDEYTEVLRVVCGAGAGAVCGVLAVRLGGLGVARRCLQLNHSLKDLSIMH